MTGTLRKAMANPPGPVVSCPSTPWGKRYPLVFDTAFLVTWPYCRYNIACAFKRPLGIARHGNFHWRLIAPRQFLADPAEEFELRFVDVLQTDFRQAASFRAPKCRPYKQGCTNTATANQRKLHRLLQCFNYAIGTGYNQLCQSNHNNNFQTWNPDVQTGIHRQILCWLVLNW
jgi:hypothetical protein